MERGGTVFSLGSNIFYCAMIWDENAVRLDSVPDAEAEADMDPNEEEDLNQPEYDALLECRNDLEYGFVSRMCGYAQVCAEPYKKMMFLHI
jgi:hypothetical protein